MQEQPGAWLNRQVYRCPDGLAGELIEARYDLKHIFRLILYSNTYQLSCVASDADSQSAANFAHYPLRRLEAEVLVDALCQITGTTETYSSMIPEPFTFIPEKQRSITLPIEEAVAGCHGVEEIESQSRHGFSRVTVKYKRGTDMDFARLELAEQLGADHPRLHTIARDLAKTHDALGDAEAGEDAEAYRSAAARDLAVMQVGEHHTQHAHRDGVARSHGVVEIVLESFEHPKILP